jgi:hypothetical protein
VIDNKSPEYPEYPCADCGTLDTGRAGHFDGCAKNCPAPPRETEDDGNNAEAVRHELRRVERWLRQVQDQLAQSEDARRKAEAERDKALEQIAVAERLKRSLPPMKGRGK